jgi:glycosyltransferase involved in cell wall biosynthesis
VAAQTFTDYEIILVDDGSTDHTDEIVESFKWLNLRYIKIANSERGAARNRGMEAAKGLYFTFLDSDDLLETNFFEHAHTFLEHSRRPFFAHVGYSIQHSETNKVRRMDAVSSGRGDFIIRGNPLSCIGVLMHHALFPTYRFKEDRRLAGSEDWELWIRILAKYGVVADSKPVARIVDHSGRSVLSYDENKLFQRKSLAVSYALADPLVRQEFGKYQHRIDAYWFTYVSLHLAISNKSKAALRYFLLGFMQYPPVLFTKRAAVILKKILLD